MVSFDKFLALQPVLSSPVMQLQERWILNENDVPEYYAISPDQTAGDDELLWMVYKYTYGGTDNNVPIIKELPGGGPGFKYSITDIASYF